MADSDETEVESRVRVRYKETDQMGIAHHSNYVVWFEIGRTDLCRRVGVRYAEIEARGFVLVVTEMNCRFQRPFLYDDEVVMRTRISELNSRGIRFAYELLNLSGECHARGTTSHIWLDRVTRRPVMPPEDLAAPFRELFAKTAQPSTPRRRRPRL